MFQGNLNRTGATETIPITGNTPIWTYNFSSGDYDFISDSPVIANGCVYIGELVLGNISVGKSYDKGVLHCLNATTGISIWNYTTESEIMWSVPVIANEMLYFGDFNGTIYCLNANSGIKLWNFTTGDKVFSSPAVWNGMVYVGSDDNNTYCLNATTGKLLWKYVTSGPIVRSSPVITNGMVYIGSSDNNTYCLNATTGALIWNYTTGGPITFGPVVAQGMIFVTSFSIPSSQESPGHYDTKIYCFNAFNGSLIWKNTIIGGFPSSFPSVAYGRVYIGSVNSNIYCLNETTGKYMWKYQTAKEGGCSSLAIANGMVYVGKVVGGNFYCLNAFNGALIWNYTLGQSSMSSPAIVNGMVYIASFEGVLYCFPMIIASTNKVNGISFGGAGEIFLFSLIGITTAILIVKKRKK
ncbi:MAG: PQQ-binding-like beta-propeller repeat protein [Candidatus Lokiarchaeota archaeon]